MHYYLILDSDFKDAGSTIQIVRSSSRLEDLDLINTYNPTDKITIPFGNFQFLKDHNITNAQFGKLQPAKIYKEGGSQ